MASQSKQIYFNIDTEKILLDYANKVSFSKWVKEKIREEIQQKEVKSQVDQQVQQKLAEVNQPVIKKSLVWKI